MKFKYQNLPISTNLVIIFILLLMMVGSVSAYTLQNMPSGYSTDSNDYLLALDFEDGLTNSSSAGCNIETTIVANGSKSIACGTNTEGGGSAIGQGNFKQTSSDFTCEAWVYWQTTTDNMGLGLVNSTSVDDNDLWYKQPSIYYHHTISYFSGWPGTTYMTPNVLPVTGSWHNYKIHYRNQTSTIVEKNLTYDFVEGTNYLDSDTYQGNDNGIAQYSAFLVATGSGGTANPTILDNILCYEGTVAPIPVVTPIINSSWLVTYGVASYDTGNEWNSAAAVDVILDPSFTVTTNEATNMSCSLTNANYTTMVALDSNYKSTTTNTTSHSYTLYDSLSFGNQCVYCSFVKSDGTGELAASSSGCLNTYLLRGPSVTLNHPADGAIILVN